jgi:hypothetical protein
METARDHGRAGPPFVTRGGSLRLANATSGPGCQRGALSGASLASCAFREGPASGSTWGRRAEASSVTHPAGTRVGGPHWQRAIRVSPGDSNLKAGPGRQGP